MKISKWLKSGVIDKHIRDNLQSTIDALACPLKTDKKTIRLTLCNVLNKDQAFRKKSAANIKVHGWLNSSFKKANFNKTRYTGNIATTNRGTPPPVQEEFSFTVDEQGAITETFYNLIEIELYVFLVDNERIIPAKIVEAFATKQCPKVNTDFENADTLCMLNFIIENINIFTDKSAFHGKNSANAIEIFKDYKKNVRHKMAHGIVNESGQWSDLSLQNVSLLACKVVECLGGNYKDLYMEREKVNEKITQRLIQKRKLYDNSMGDSENMSRKNDTAMNDNSTEDSNDTAMNNNSTEDSEDTSRKNGRKRKKTHQE